MQPSSAVNTNRAVPPHYMFSSAIVSWTIREAFHDILVVVGVRLIIVLYAFLMFFHYSGRGLLGSDQRNAVFKQHVVNTIIAHHNRIISYLIYSKGVVFFWSLFKWRILCDRISSRFLQLKYLSIKTQFLTLNLVGFIPFPFECPWYDPLTFRGALSARVLSSL